MAASVASLVLVDQVSVTGEHTGARSSPAWRTRTVHQTDAWRGCVLQGPIRPLPTSSFAQRAHAWLAKWPLKSANSVGIVWCPLPMHPTMARATVLRNSIRTLSASDVANSRKRLMSETSAEFKYTTDMYYNRVGGRLPCDWSTLWFFRCPNRCKTSQWMHRVEYKETSLPYSTIIIIIIYHKPNVACARSVSICSRTSALRAFSRSSNELLTRRTCQILMRRMKRGQAAMTSGRTSNITIVSRQMILFQSV